MIAIIFVILALLALTVRISVTAEPSFFKGFIVALLAELLAIIAIIFILAII